MTVNRIERRDFLKLAAAGSAICLGASPFCPSRAAAGSPIVSPGCRKSKVKVARIYLGKPKAHWPKPTLELKEEAARYDSEFARLGKAFADVEFVPTALVTTVEEARALREALQGVDGVLAIHLSMGIMDLLPIER